VFGTLVDWRASVAREARQLLAARGVAVDWEAFADAWRGALDPATASTVLDLASEAGTLADQAARRLGIGGENDTVRASTLEMAEALGGFHFPDDLWARVVYDLVLAARRGDVEPSRLVAALVPIYFGRVGSLVVEARHLDAADAEERVERQAREFELLKPYLVERWRALFGAADTVTAE